MSRTYELSEYQKAQLIPTRDMWIKIGLNCDEADWQEAARGAVMAYRAENAKPPKQMAYFRSPIEGAAAAAMLLQMNDMKELPKQVRGAVDEVLARHGVTKISERRAMYRQLRETSPGPHRQREASEEELKLKPSQRVPKRLVRYVIPYWLSRTR